MFIRVLLLLLALTAPIQMALAGCDERSLQGAYAASGQLSFDEGSRSDERISIPVSAMFVFDGAGSLAVEDLVVADFDGFSGPRFDFAFGQGAYSIKENCAGTLRFDLSLEGESVVLAEVTMPVVLFGSGAVAEGFKGTLILGNLSSGDSGDIGRMEAVRQRLQTTGDSGEALHLTLEEPVNQSTASGVSNIRGWAVAPSGIDRLELLINDVLATEIPYGGDRRDVGAAFPDIAGSSRSGFGQTFNYGLLGAGRHTITVRAYSNAGGMVERTSTFTVAAFKEPFVEQQGYPSLAQADAAVNQAMGNIIIHNVILPDGSTYDVTLNWSKAAQSFTMAEVLEFVVN